MRPVMSGTLQWHCRQIPRLAGGTPACWQSLLRLLTLRTSYRPAAASDRSIRARAIVATAACLAVAASLGIVAAAAQPAAPAEMAVPKPVPAKRPSPAKPSPPATAGKPATKPDAAQAAAQRARVMAGVRGFAYQLVGLSVDEASRSPYDLIVVDATTGRGDGEALTAADIAKLKRKPDGGRRLVLSYLSIGEAEDYRPDYFAKEYITETEPPDWLMKENPQWKGNRIIRFCKEGWQRTVLGDDDGRSLYNSIEPSPLYRLVELGLDGVALDRVDVYGEVKGECPDARAKMIDFVARLAAHARKKNPQFMVILHNTEETLADKKMITAIDAILKEDLFVGVNGNESANPEVYVREALNNLAAAKAAGRPVFVIDYLSDRGRIADDKRRIAAQGFIGYFGPRRLDKLWLPGVNF